MATFIKGNAVANATGYELFEKASDGTYSSLANDTEINFELENLNLPAGNHTLVVKAKGDGTNYLDSDYSNEVVYSVSADTSELAGTWLMNETIDLTGFGGTKGTDMGVAGMNLYKGYHVNYTAGTQASEYLLTHISAAGILAYCVPGSSSASFLYNDSKWGKAEYRTIVITSALADVSNGEILLAWLIANAVKIS